MIADRTAYTTYGVYRQTVKPVSVTNLLTAMHDPIQRVEFMNATKLYLLKRDHGQTKVQ